MSDSKFGYEDLEVWQRSLDWAAEIISLVEAVATERKHYRLVEQLEAASCSVPQNIAEGKGRFHRKEFVQFLYIALGSLYETVTLLELFKKQEWISAEDFNSLKSGAQTIARMLNALINSIR